MLKTLFSVIVLYCFGIVSSKYGDILGCGKWNVLSVSTCPDEEQYELRPQCGKRKMNHTHDSFYGEVDLDFDFDNSIGVLIFRDGQNAYLEIYKECDGGIYKLYSTVKEECLCCIAKKYAEEDVELALSMMGVDPPDCPIPKGHYELSNFVFNYDRLKQKKWVYGKFKVFAYMTTGVDDNMERIGCIKSHFEYAMADTDQC